MASEKDGPAIAAIRRSHRGNAINDAEIFMGYVGCHNSLGSKLQQEHKQQLQQLLEADAAMVYAGAKHPWTHLGGQTTDEKETLREAHALGER
jgi:hypothetical protein